MIRYGATTLQTNTWYNIAAVYDAAAQTLHVYLNGQLDDGTASRHGYHNTADIGTRRRDRPASGISGGVSVQRPH